VGSSAYESVITARSHTHTQTQTHTHIFFEIFHEKAEKRALPSATFFLGHLRSWIAGHSTLTPARTALRRWKCWTLPSPCAQAWGFWQQLLLSQAWCVWVGIFCMYGRVCACASMFVRTH